MSRSRALRRFFWGHVAQALRLQEASISEKGWGTSYEIVLAGRASGFEYEAGAYWEGSGQSSVQYLFAAVPLSGIPHGLSVDGQAGLRPTESIEVDCEDGRIRSVTLSSIPVLRGDLRLEQLSVVLGEFLTPGRREAICAMHGNLQWVDGGHRLERRMRCDPYPETRVLADALAGEPEAMQTMWEHRDRVVALVEGALTDAQIVVRELRT